MCWSGFNRTCFALLRSKYFVDELYEATVIRFNAWCGAGLRLAG